MHQQIHILSARKTTTGYIQSVNVIVTYTCCKKMANSVVLEELKPWLSSHVVATLGLYRNDVADISISCLSSDLKRKDAIGETRCGSRYGCGRTSHRHPI